MNSNTQTQNIYQGVNYYHEPMTIGEVIHQGVRVNEAAKKIQQFIRQTRKTPAKGTRKFIPKRTIVLECRCCGNLGYYEDIRDDYSADEPDFEFGTCGECDPYHQESSDEDE